MKFAARALAACVAFSLMLLLLLILMVAALPARAQTASGPQCGPWPDVAAGLVGRYGEALLFEGTPAPGGQRIVITAKPDGTTWTALTVDAHGMACVRSAGGGWRTGGSPVAPGQEG